MREAPEPPVAGASPSCDPIEAPSPLNDDNDVDLTLSPITDKVWLEVTSRCNLRCTYCHLSHENIPEVDIDLAHFDKFVQGLVARGATELIFQGRGENSFLAGWHNYVRKALDAGLIVTAVTNLSRVYSDEELDVFSRFGSLTISVDTTEPALFRAIRRKADIKVVLTNIMQIRAIALAQRRSPPSIIWNMIVHDQSAGRLGRSICDGIAAGVNHFHLSVLSETPELPGLVTPRQLDVLSPEERRQVIEQLRQVHEISVEHGCRVTMAPGLDLLLSKLSIANDRPVFEISG
jgi:hypothetical protein